MSATQTDQAQLHAEAITTFARTLHNDTTLQHIDSLTGELLTHLITEWAARNT